MDYANLIKIEDLPNSGVEDATGLAELGQEVEDFLVWHQWWGAVRQGYLDYGLYGILALFCFEIDPDSPNADDNLWVIVGDVPLLILTWKAAQLQRLLLRDMFTSYRDGLMR